MEEIKIANKKIELPGIVIGIACAIVIGFWGCSPNADDILKKYEEHHVVESNQNKHGLLVADVSFEENFRFDVLAHKSGKTLYRGDAFIISFNCSDISDYLTVASKMSDKGKSEILEEHFIILNAAKTSKTIEFESFDSREYRYSINIAFPSNKTPKFILVGFKGIRESKIETPTMFFLFEKDGNELKLLTSQPLLANNLFPTNDLELTPADIPDNVQITLKGGKMKIDMDVKNGEFHFVDVNGGKKLSYNKLILDGKEVVDTHCWDAAFGGKNVAFAFKRGEIVRSGNSLSLNNCRVFTEHVILNYKLEDEVLTILGVE